VHPDLREAPIPGAERNFHLATRHNDLKFEIFLITVLFVGEWDALEISAASLVRGNFKFDVAFTSCLKRAHQTLDTILKEINCTNIPIHYAWRLNERHYGALTGFNKRQMADVYGEEQVSARSFGPMPCDAMNFVFEGTNLATKFRHLSTTDYTAESLLRADPQQSQV
jgi:2,3-bisphosphoglycerate-dependent phosphoglycerate mutase